MQLGPLPVILCGKLLEFGANSSSSKHQLSLSCSPCRYYVPRSWLKPTQDSHICGNRRSEDIQALYHDGYNKLRSQKELNSSLSYNTRVPITEDTWFAKLDVPIRYFINRIPIGPSLQDLDVTFLTFHSLSRHQMTVVPVYRDPSLDLLFTSLRFLIRPKVPCMVLTRLRIGVSSLMNSTENWLRSLNVYHPDFVFFKNHDFMRNAGSIQDKYEAIAAHQEL
ncbi:hypothetical protein Tco_1326181 [Tanacetum coccineum]